MTTFDPSLAALDRPDQLGGALQQGLPRPMNPKLTWGLIRTFFLSALTGGIVPTLILPKRFRDFATAEQLQFWHLAEWLRLQTGDSEAAAATEAARRVTPGFGFRWLSVTFVVVAIAIACTALQHKGSLPLPSRWLALTLPQLNLADFKPPLKTAFSDQRGYGWHQDSSSRSERDISRDAPRYLPDARGPSGPWFRIYHPGESNPESDPRVSFPNGMPVDSGSTEEEIAASRPPTISIDLVNAFALAMSGAALCWLIEINAHIAKVRRFVGAFNQLSGRYGVGPVGAPGVQLGLRPLWILGAAATCTLGGYWAVPVMLAAAAHRRYIKHTSLRLRSDLARRQRDVLLARRPAIRVPASKYLMGVCPRENCRAPLPPEAVFCRRCGTKLAP